MKKITTFSLILTLVVSIASVSFAGNKARTGTAGGTEVLIPVSAKNLALSNSFTSSLQGIDGVAINPASIGLMAKNEAIFSSLNYVADINLYYFAAGLNFGDAGNFGFSIRSLDFGKIDKTTNSNPYGTGETFSPTFVTLGVSYGRELTENIQFGTTFKYVHESILNAKAGGIGLDIGFQYSGSGILPGLNFGIAIKNLGLNKMNFDGQSLANTEARTTGAPANAAKENYRTPTEYFDLPSSFEFGLSYAVELDDLQSVTFGSNYINNNLSNDAYNFGGEYNFQDMLFLRGGYSHLPTAVDHPFGATFGVGLKYNVGFDLTLDYAYRQVEYFTDANQLISVKIGI
ncbi:MAG: PorV/PorQ family protein [Bacteroidetes bacterium]|nr:PorV/PorQ family protein [Bacteroidota bacterium]